MTPEVFNEKYVLIDCRYPYEYKGGHIKVRLLFVKLISQTHFQNAINVHNAKDLPSVFYPVDSDNNKKVIGKVPIFYCEFSQKRGPGM